jgi:hypothetical protein
VAKRNLPMGGAVPMEPGERDRDGDDSAADGRPWVIGFRRRSGRRWRPRVFMRKLDTKASERFVAGQLSGEATTQWEMGYRADMDPELVDVTKKRRLVYQGRIYDITSASQIGRREGMELLTIDGGQLA